MPDRLIDLFIQLCLQNNGRLSTGKRESHFGFPTDDELAGPATKRTERQCSSKATGRVAIGSISLLTDVHLEPGS